MVTTMRKRFAIGEATTALAQRLIVCAVALALGSAFVACGGGDTAGGGSSTTPEATQSPSSQSTCLQLLTPDEATQLLGETVVVDTPNGGCVYKGAGTDQLSVTGFSQGADPVAALATFKANKAPTDTDVEGLGDAAYYYQSTDPNSESLCALHGTGGICVNIYSGRGHDANLAIAKQVTGIALGRIQ